MMTKSRADGLSLQHSQGRTNIHGFGMKPLEKSPLGRPSRRRDISNRFVADSFGAHGRDQCGVLVMTPMNLHIP